MVFSDRLKTAMQNKNMTVSELACLSGIHTHTIYLYLEPEKYGRNINPRIVSLETLAKALDVSIDWLWGRDTKEDDKWDRLMMYLADLELTYSVGMLEADKMKYNLIHAIKCELEGWE